MPEMSEYRSPKLIRRQEKMASMMRSILNAMEHSIKTGRPCFHTPEVQSIIGHFEADRVRVEQFVNETRDRKERVMTAVMAGKQRIGRQVETMNTAELERFMEAALEAVDVLP
jgi:hypothetical protein